MQPFVVSALVFSALVPLLLSCSEQRCSPSEAEEAASETDASEIVDANAPLDASRAASDPSWDSDVSDGGPGDGAGESLEGGQHEAEVTDGSVDDLESCGDTTIRSAADLKASQQCAEIRGNLYVATSGLVAIASTDLPHLSKVTGDVWIAALNGNAATPLVQSMTFASLREIGGLLLVGGTTSGSLRELRFPALTTVGRVGDTARRVQIELAADLQNLELPVLATVNGSVTIAGLNRLCSLKLGTISFVSGDISLGAVPNIPASTFAPLIGSSQGNVTQQQVGCCSVVDNVSCQSFTAENRSTFCGC